MINKKVRLMLLEIKLVLILLSDDPIYLKYKTKHNVNSTFDNKLYPDIFTLTENYYIYIKFLHNYPLLSKFSEKNYNLSINHKLKVYRLGIF